MEFDKQNIVDAIYKQIISIQWDVETNTGIRLGFPVDPYIESPLRYLQDLIIGQAKLQSLLRLVLELGILDEVKDNINKHNKR